MIDHALYPVILQHLHDTIHSAFVIDKGRTGAGTGTFVGERPHDTVGTLIDDRRRIVCAALAHAGLVRYQRAAHLFYQKRYLEVREYDRRTCDQDARTVLLTRHLTAFCFRFYLITKVVHILCPQRDMRVADCVHRRHVVRPLDCKGILAPELNEAGQLILRCGGHAASP